jgi:hypothetical protein
MLVWGHNINSTTNRREANMWMNRHDIEMAEYHFAGGETPNLYAGARALHALMDWTDDNSDGWPYWRQPSSAAKRLMDLLSAHTYAAYTGDYQGTGNPLHDVTEGDVKRALTPVRAFLTRQSVDAEAVLA